MYTRICRNKTIGYVFIVIIAIISIAMGIIIGSTNISLQDIIATFTHKIFFQPLSETVSPITVDVIWTIRLPRVIVAFLAGAILSVCGAVMQSVLKNPLASCYGLGVSAGAGLGVTLFLFLGLTSSVSSYLLMPSVATLFGVSVIFFVTLVARKIDYHLYNHTVILFGMVISLFINAIMTYMSALMPQHAQRISWWQLGSFSMKNKLHVIILSGVLILGVVYFIYHSKELDILTFGDEQALSMGVNSKRVKGRAIVLTALLASVSVAFVGIIGFVDLIIPHIVRRIFGASHKRVIPLSALLGGIFMVLCDLISRTIIAPSEIPVGTVTAIVGTPFFIYLYFIGSKKK